MKKDEGREREREREAKTAPLASMTADVDPTNATPRTPKRDAAGEKGEREVTEEEKL